MEGRREVLAIADFLSVGSYSYRPANADDGCSMQEGGAEEVEEQARTHDQRHLWEPVGVVCKGWTHTVCQGSA